MTHSPTHHCFQALQGVDISVSVGVQASVQAAQHEALKQAKQMRIQNAAANAIGAGSSSGYQSNTNESQKMIQQTSESGPTTLPPEWLSKIQSLTSDTELKALQKEVMSEKRALHLANRTLQTDRHVASSAEGKQQLSITRTKISELSQIEDALQKRMLEFLSDQRSRVGAGGIAVVPVGASTATTADSTAPPAATADSGTAAASASSVPFPSTENHKPCIPGTVLKSPRDVLNEEEVIGTVQRSEKNSNTQATAGSENGRGVGGAVGNQEQDSVAILLAEVDMFLSLGDGLNTSEVGTSSVSTSSSSSTSTSTRKRDAQKYLMRIDEAIGHLPASSSTSTSTSKSKSRASEFLDFEGADGADGAGIPEGSLQKQKLSDTRLRLQVFITGVGVGVGNTVGDVAGAGETAGGETADREIRDKPKPIPVPSSSVQQQAGVAGVAGVAGGASSDVVGGASSSSGSTSSSSSSSSRSRSSSSAHTEAEKELHAADGELRARILAIPGMQVNSLSLLLSPLTHSLSL